MTSHSLPTRALPPRPDLDQLKRQAKELLNSFVGGEALAVAEVTTHYHDADPATFALHDALLVLARAYGFESWPTLKAAVEGVTIEHLTDAVRARDLPRVRSMLRTRPELASKAADNFSPLHLAVLNRDVDMVRVLMQRGASARHGVYPYRETTSALTLASERGYAEIVAAIEDEEARRRQAASGLQAAPAPDELFAVIRAGDEARAIALMEADPALVQTCHQVFEWTPLHVAAFALNARLVAWLLERGADVTRRDRLDHTPLDLAARRSREATADHLKAVATLLLGRGAALTPCAAAALGDAEWLRARSAESVLVNPIEDDGGCLRVAASHNRPDIVALLLDLGFDPNERTRFQAVGRDLVVVNWGMPLWECATSGRHQIAELLLHRGADPNADVYASGTPVAEAHRQNDPTMIELLRRFGGVIDAGTAGAYGLTDRAKEILAGPPRDQSGQNVAEQLLGGAAGGGHPEIVRLALERVDWPRDDARWFGVLEQPVRRGTDLECFRLVLERCDPNIRGRGPFGLTILHSVAGSRDHVTAEMRVAFATMLLDAGARLDLRDNLLKSTPLAWACRWGRVELVQLLLARGADPVEADAEPWAAPEAWAKKMQHDAVLAALKAGQN
jgi:ankyrin repeat protein